MEAKAQMRREVLSVLRTKTALEARSSGESALSVLAGWEGYERAPQVAAFSSLPGEIDTRPICAAIRAASKPLLFPRIQDRRLEFVRVDQDRDLVDGRFGLREPRPGHGPAVDVRNLGSGAIVLVPGIAFDRSGGRLGRGAGYYDRALADGGGASNRPTLIGIGFPDQIVDRVPMTALDVRMDGILTERELVWVERIEPAKNDD